MLHGKDAFNTIHSPVQRLIHIHLQGRLTQETAAILANSRLGMQQLMFTVLKFFA